MKPKSYSGAGVDIRKVKKSHSEILFLARKTFGFRKPGMGAPLNLVGHYGGLVDLGPTAMVLHTDGVGTKVLVAEALGDYSTIGIDAVAVTVNDIVCLGAEPVSMLDYIALQKPDRAIVSEIMKGIFDGCRQSGCSLAGGETAIVPDLIKSKVDLVTMGVGLVGKGDLITGSEIEAGDSVVGLESSGIHSNGLTLARKVLPKSLYPELLVPTRIYVKPALEMVKRCKVRGLAHITGGAFSKLTRILPKGTGALLDFMPEPQPVFREIQRRGKVSDREMYRTFNMGIGFAVVTQEPESVIKVAKKRGIGAAGIVGSVNKKAGKVEIVANGRRFSVT